MFKLLRRSLYVGLLCALLALNVLTLTWSAATAAVSGLLGALGVGTVYSQLDNRARTQARQVAAQKKRLAVQKRSLRRVGGRIRARTVRSAAANIGSLPAEAVPFLGWAVVIGVTGYELRLACQNLRDLDTLYRDMDLAPDDNRAIMDTLCNPDLKRLQQAGEDLPGELRAEYLEYREWVRHQRSGATPGALPDPPPPGAY